MSTLRELLEEYRRVTRELKQLGEVRDELRGQITAKLHETGSDAEKLEFEDETVSLKLRRSEAINYDETLLQQRLGDNYALILEPDLSKIRKRLPDLEEALKPHLALIGSPSRDLAKGQIDSGTISAEAFRDAFEKTARETLFVSRRTKK